MELITIALFFVVAVLCGLHLWNKNSNNYFKKHKVPYVPAPLFGGHLKDMLLQKKAMPDILMDLYNNESVKDAPVIGIRFLHHRGLIIKDLELLKRIMIKDFQSFTDRRIDSDPVTDVLGGTNMFMAKNPMWKIIRSKITPVFSTIKLKGFHSMVNEIGDDLHNYLMENVPDSKVVDVKDLIGIFTTDIIASCAYGVKANGLTDPNSEFRKEGKEIFHFSPLRAIEYATLFFWPEIVPYFRLKLFTKKAGEFLAKTLTYVMDEREKNNIARNDLIDILIDLRKADRDKAPSYSNTVAFKDDILVAQAAVFFTAGFEPTASAISFTLYEMAKQPEIQDRLRAEIKDFMRKHNNEVAYDNIHEMTYLSMVCQETLRMYPSLSYVDRECTPVNGAKSYSLKPVIDFDIPRGMPIYIPTHALHRDEKYFPDPDKYNPERFSPENIGSIPHCAYIPFGLGPRNCLGERFGNMQLKLGVIHFLKSHRVEFCDKSTPNMTFHRMAMLLTPLHGIHLNVIRDKDV